jgi:hypothetical protein
MKVSSAFLVMIIGACIGLCTSSETAIAMSDVNSGGKKGKKSKKGFILSFRHGNGKVGEAQCSEQLRTVQNSIFGTYVNELLGHSADMTSSEAEETVSSAFAMDMDMNMNMNKDIDINMTRRLSREPSKGDRLVASDIETKERELQPRCKLSVCDDNLIIIRFYGCCSYCRMTCRRRLGEGDRSLAQAVSSSLPNVHIGGSKESDSSVTNTKVNANANALSSNLGYQSAALFYSNVKKLLDDTDPCKNVLNAMLFDIVIVDSDHE